MAPPRRSPPGRRGRLFPAPDVGDRVSGLRVPAHEARGTTGPGKTERPIRRTRPPRRPGAAAGRVVVGVHWRQAIAGLYRGYRRWYGQARRPHYGTTFAAACAGEPQVVDAAAPDRGHESGAAGPS